MKLTHPTLLRAFIAKHRASIKIFERQALRQPAGNHRAHHASCIFRAQGQLFTTAVCKTVIFFGDDITALAKRTGEYLGKFKNWRGHFLKAISCRGQARRINHQPVLRHHIRKKISSAPNRLQFRHNSRRLFTDIFSGPCRLYFRHTCFDKFNNMFNNITIR